MKTFKKLIAVILCMAVISGLCVTSAFAYKTGNLVDFEYLDSTKGTYYYVGEVTEGENLIKVTEENKNYTVFYEFEAKKNGNYSFVNGGWNFFELTDSGMKEIDEEVYDYSMDSVYVYLEKGTYYIPDGFYGPCPDPSNINVRIDFLGEYEGVYYDKEAFRDVVLFEDYDYQNKTLKNANPRIKFSEKELEWQFGEIYLEFESALLLGEKTVTFEIMGQKFTETLELVSAAEIIDSIEVVDIEKYIGREYYYDGEILETYDEPEEIVVYFKDGTSETAKNIDNEDNGYSEYVVEFPNGREYTIRMDSHSDGITVDFGGVYFVKETGDFEDAGYIKNFHHFINNIFTYMVIIEDFGWKIPRIFDEIKLFGSYLFDSPFIID